MSNLTEKPIAELLGMNFFIPSYQRGYRWTERQVKDLLDDINAFTPVAIEKSESKTWYCLQPIVVKECDEETKKKNNLQGTWYEVIDGQQRLTTIFLIVHYANEMWIGKQKITEFQLKYETRDESFDFLKNQKIEEEEEEDRTLINYENIDFHHITNAYNTIHTWVKEYKNKFNIEFDNNNFQSKFKSNSKVIWYEVDGKKDAIEIFTRINMGKIPLTNAELIKALFLNSSNFQNSNIEEIRLRQLEIASEWDRIEYSLQDKEFWYFLNELGAIPSTRIEYIFNIMYSIAKEDCLEVKYRKENKITSNEKIEQRIKEGHYTTEEINGIDEYSTFRFFSEKFKLHNNTEIDFNWKEIKRVFQTIEEWFSERELYHKIGYLIATGVKMEFLLKKVKNKKEFKRFLDSQIKNKVNIVLIDLEYKNRPVKDVLLLHNIETMLNFKKETSRFPFDRYKTEKWDIEHIHAIATEVHVNKESQVSWLLDNFVKTPQHTSEVLNEKIETIKNTKNPIEDKSFEEIVGYVLGEEDNTIKNLCLLDRGTNRSYKNDSFKAKRRKIIESEKRGIFIPICTKNVFMKYYSDELKHLELWNEADRGNYLNNIETVIYQKEKTI
jgi:uncharacterized protein with ParB-like and HNH nuclease domain